MNLKTVICFILLVCLGLHCFRRNDVPKLCHMDFYMKSALQKVFLFLFLIHSCDSDDLQTMFYSTCSSYNVILTLGPTWWAKEWDLCSFHVNLVVHGSDTLWPPMRSHKRWFFFFCFVYLGPSLNSVTILYGSPRNLQRGPYGEHPRPHLSGMYDWTPNQ